MVISHALVLSCCLFAFRFSDWNIFFFSSSFHRKGFICSTLRLFVRRGYLLHALALLYYPEIWNGLIIGWDWMAIYRKMSNRQWIIYHKTSLVVYVYKVRNDWEYPINESYMHWISTYCTVLYVFLSIQTSKKRTKNRKKERKKLSRKNINQSKRSPKLCSGNRNEKQGTKRGTQKEKDDEACVLCFSHPWMQQGNMRVWCMYVCMAGKFKARQTQNKRGKKSRLMYVKRTKQEKVVMRGRIGIDCNTMGTSLPSIIG